MNEKMEASLRNVVAELNRESAELLLLRYVDDHSDAEIARMLGTSRGAIPVRLCRIRARIRKLMRANDRHCSFEPDGHIARKVWQHSL